MTRTSFAASIVVFAALLLTGCNKPSDESCRKAIANMRSLIGTNSQLAGEVDIEGDVRRCKGGSKKKTVECAAAATTIEELRACEFMKIPAKTGGAGSDTTGSAAGSSAAGSETTGSAAGSAPTGSAATGAGSDMSGSAPGSAAAGSGSEMSGSAAAGSAAGSGSAAK